MKYAIEKQKRVKRRETRKKRDGWFDVEHCDDMKKVFSRHENNMVKRQRKYGRQNTRN